MELNGKSSLSWKEIILDRNMALYKAMKNSRVKMSENINA